MAKVDLERVRAFWLAKQGLLEPVGGDVAALVEATGWVRTLGGVEAYLALRARRAGITRAEIDAALAARDVQVLPAARGCIYLVPRSDAPAALALAESLARTRRAKEVAAAGAKPAEVTKLARQVLGVLDEPRTTDAIRKALPAKAVRSLGEAGKQVGLSSLLPVALRDLEFRGAIDRITESGRLDSERYLWRRADGREVAAPKIPLADVTARFLAYAGPATAKEVADFTGAAQRDVKAALAELRVASVEVDGYARDALVLADDVGALEAQEPAPPKLTLLPTDDNLLTWRGGPRVFADAKHHARLVESWGSSKPVALGEAKHLGRAVMRGAELVGFWEADVARGEATFALFTPVPATQKKELALLGHETVAFLKEELGHARTFSLDTDEHVAARAAAMRT
jgi:hypothetical protein